ncbi:MAG: flagellar basal body L-ring protein FlgH [Proteobacteria bacterium]|nr:flagellar basal body L-ring protein FlgH [Pseudomonadota bacterium]
MKFSSASLFSVCAFSALTFTGNSVQAGSLWLKEGSTEQSMFADKIARNIGDILTIVVSEDTSTQQTARIKTYENTQGGTGIFPALNATLNGFVQALPSWLSKSSGGAVDQNDVTIPTLDIAAKSEWNGGGDTQNTLTLTNRTAVTVVDVLPNGNLVVEGAKIIRAGQESQYAYMRGIVRPIDIASDNTIPSTKIADAQVEFIPEGELTEAQKKGWLVRIWDKIKPMP